MAVSGSGVCVVAVCFCVGHLSPFPSPHHLSPPARRVFAFASHGLFSGPANERIEESVLEEVVVVNSIPLNDSVKNNGKITQV